MSESLASSTTQVDAEYLHVPHIAKDRDFREAIIACDKLLTSKGHDYTQGAEGDYGRLKNFYTSADAFKSLTPYTCLGVLFKKHIDAIYTFLDKGRVESEPIEGRIHDAINYLLLAYKMVQYEKRKATEGLPTTTTTVQKGSAVYPMPTAVQKAVVDNQGLVK